MTVRSEADEPVSIVDSEAVSSLTSALLSVAEPERASRMRAYMKDRFEFLGVPSPERRRAAAPFIASFKGAGQDRLLHAAAVLWTMPQREYAYVAADLLRRYERVLSPAALGPLQTLVTTDSWWDGVDALAHVVGAVVRAHTEAADVMDAWAGDDDLWVVRVAIIHQLGWKADAEPERIFGYCVEQAAHRDFFVRKAIGWALRDLARTYPDDVRSFVAAHSDVLSPLSVREATKHLAQQAIGVGPSF
ncbi:MAG: DNA alkylation repair protein [Microthrixaceae bacterium]